MARAWWRSLTTDAGEIKLPERHRPELSRFYQSWKSWTVRTTSREGAAFRICFRLEPPDLQAGVQNWRLSYFLQASDDPSLLVPPG